MATTHNFSSNKKLNAVLNEIAQDLNEMGRNEVLHYYNTFTREIDYNIVQFGNMLIYYEDVRLMYKRCGYKSMDKMSDQKVWEIYKRQAGYLARLMVMGVI